MIKYFIGRNMAELEDSPAFYEKLSDVQEDLHDLNMSLPENRKNKIFKVTIEEVQSAEGI